VTAHIRIMNEDEAQGQVVEDYAYLSRSDFTLVGSEVTTPNVYRTHSIVLAYFCLFIVANWVLTNDGKFDRPESQQGRCRNSWSTLPRPWIVRVTIERKQLAP